MHLAACAAAALIAGAASAQVVPIGPFPGDRHEGFESFPKGVGPQLVCFNGAATATQIGGTQGLYVINAWIYLNVPIFARSGFLFMGGTSNVTVEWEFGTPARRFGGYFGTNYVQPGANATFYDEAGQVIASLPVACPNGGQWAWSGWQTTGPAIKRVRIAGANPASGHVMHDDLVLTFDLCYADCNADGALTVADFGCFQTKFALVDPYADCNNDLFHTVADFGCFQTRFVAGCP